MRSGPHSLAALLAALTASPARAEGPPSPHSRLTVAGTFGVALGDPARGTEHARLSPETASTIGGRLRGKHQILDRLWLGADVAIATWEGAAARAGYRNTRVD